MSFLLCLPLLVMVKRERLVALYFVGFFALLPDLLHLGDLRIFAHSLVGLSIMLLISFAVLAVLFRPRPVMYAIGAVAAFGHLLGDLYIGSIYPFWPWDGTWYHLHLFNSPFDITTEVVLSSIALVLLVVLFGPFRLHGSRRRLDRREAGSLYLLGTIVAAMALLQGGYYALILYLGGGDVLRYTLLLFFAAPFLFTAAVLLPMTFPMQEGRAASGPSSSGLRKL
ncbi:hypothetical protein AOA80_11450 [Methanomassiliicoccales archaeon RumEn M1]|nr:hypothetical protein AOA80_11450 [Methanomassiliicoccales archaeon RumEn M1]